LRILAAAGIFLLALFAGARRPIIQTDSPHSRTIFRPIFWMWGALVLITLVMIACIGWRDLRVPYELDYGEGAVMWQTANILNPARAYAPLDTGPLVIWNYTPAYLFVARAVWKLQGDLLWSGRVISFLSAWGIAALLAAIIYRALPARFGSAVRICAAGTGLFYLSIRSPMNWFPFMRVDWLGLLAAYLGIFFFLSARSKPWKSYLAFLFFIFAILTKQTNIAAPLACFVITLVIAPLRAVRLVMMSAAIGAVTFWLGMHWTHGGFAQHLITYNVHSFRVAHALSGLWEASMDARLFAIPAAALLLLAGSRGRSALRWRRLQAKWKHSPFFLTLGVETLHFLFAFAISLAYGKVGSNVNYFLEWTAALCVLSGMSLGVLLWQALRVPRVTATVAVILLFPLLLAASALDKPLNALFGSRTDQEIRRGRSEAYNELVPYLAATPGTVLSDDMVLLANAGKELVFEPATMRYVAEAGTWEPSGFIARIAAKEFALIVISRPDKWHPRVLAAILQNYEPDRDVGNFQIYRPRS
jgi:hypothetical protein